MEKYEIILVNLNPTKGSEQSGIRPCIIMQNNYANKVSRTFVISIISTVIKDFPHTLIIDSSNINGLDKKSRIDLLQVRTIDKTRIIKSLGILDEKHREQFDEKIKIAFGIF
ncbi:MAG: type II toxin-antitoxin system PemK/MazF family toxin [Candidatus Gracilibacteria bacterium]|nr:type II toxin-antitoxin system PemK/MazF family toxin [Candidatus Gracilibacteria bacterium]MDQ7022123.1 type II toxin-antitoxin system PemK/MazF family toxin [Candidatus Gracilibacteria bacterium]